MREATTTEVQKHFGEFIDTALSEPVTITRHNRETVVMLSAARFKEMQEALSKPMYAHEVSHELARDIEAAEYGE